MPELSYDIPATELANNVLAGSSPTTGNTRFIAQMRAIREEGATLHDRITRELLSCLHYACLAIAQRTGWSLVQSEQFVARIHENPYSELADLFTACLTQPEHFARNKKLFEAICERHLLWYDTTRSDPDTIAYDTLDIPAEDVPAMLAAVGAPPADLTAAEQEADQPRPLQGSDVLLTTIPTTLDILKIDPRTKIKHIAALVDLAEKGFALGNEHIAQALIIHTIALATSLRQAPYVLIKAAAQSSRIRVDYLSDALVAALPAEMEALLQALTRSGDKFRAEIISLIPPSETPGAADIHEIDSLIETINSQGINPFKLRKILQAAAEEDRRELLIEIAKEPRTVEIYEALKHGNGSREQALADFLINRRHALVLTADGSGNRTPAIERLAPALRNPEGSRVLAFLTGEGFEALLDPRCLSGINAFLDPPQRIPEPVRLLRAYIGFTLRGEQKKAEIVLSLRNLRLQAPELNQIIPHLEQASDSELTRNVTSTDPQIVLTTLQRAARRSSPGNGTPVQEVGWKIQHQDLMPNDLLARGVSRDDQAAVGDILGAALQSTYRQLWRKAPERSPDFTQDILEFGELPTFRALLGETHLREIYLAALGGGSSVQAQTLREFFRDPQRRGRYSALLELLFPNAPKERARRQRTHTESLENLSFVPFNFQGITIYANFPIGPEKMATLQAGLEERFGQKVDIVLRKSKDKATINPQHLVIWTTEMNSHGDFERIHAQVAPDNFFIFERRGVDPLIECISRAASYQRGKRLPPQTL